MGKIGSNSAEERINYDLCKNQAKIYEAIAENGYDVSAFSNKYLKSNFCNNFDKKWSLYHFADVEECLFELGKEIRFPRLSDSSKIYNPDIAWWIGFTYKQLQIETEKPSGFLVDLISFDELELCYSGLHTIDEEYATDIICEKHKLVKV